MLVEAAWSADKTPGPLRAFYQRVCSRRGMQIAVVATARKLAVLCCWTMIERGEDYAFARPSLTDRKVRARAARRHALPPRPKGKAAAYSLKEVRRRERELAEQAERTYRQLVSD